MLIALASLGIKYFLFLEKIAEMDPAFIPNSALEIPLLINACVPLNCIESEFRCKDIF